MTAALRMIRVWMVSMLIGALALAAPLHAEDAATTAAPETEWQSVISGQIQAFRDRDAPAAFSYASTPFHSGFPSPELFFVAIIGSGYAPIMDSTSHSFGRFTMLTPEAVIQIVKLVDKNQHLFEAAYQMVHEETGWRVSGVQLNQTPGIGV